MPGGRGSDRAGRGARDASKGSSSESKGNSGRSSESKGRDKDKSRGRGPGPIGGHDSYGMDRDTFDHTIGRDREGRSGEDKATEPSVVDKVTDYIQDKITKVEHFFTGEEDTAGFSPMGGPSSYGMSKKDFDRTIGKRRHDARSLDERLAREVDYFREAPLDYAADLLRNPMIAGAAAITGFGMTAFGVTAVDAITDYMQNEATPVEALGQLAAGAIDFTPVGAALGPVKSIARAATESPEAAVSATGALLGGKIGTAMAPDIAAAITDNPMVRAGLTAAGVAGSAALGKKAVETAMHTPSMGGVSTGMDAPDVGADRGPTSPLAASGREAVKASRRLMQPAQTDLYARTVKQLPHYGLGVPKTDLPYYGV